ncbi:hypothetical protein ACERIT_14475 [Halopenitus sp. H-Gu1]|uniref:hypothetical protein n=1 Tax=Halopenitus sp. H-Gu1 TaxID=3242697 RepID=UPI00359EDD2D
MSDGSDQVVPEDRDPSERDQFLDTADRLERSIERQISIINGIDDKSEHVTRLIGILIGLLFSVLSLIANLDSITFEDATISIKIGFILGLGSLLLAMASAIVTYLSSRFRIGLNYNVGHYMSNIDNRNTKKDFNKHIQRVCGSYGDIIEENKEVIETNSHRFRLTLYFLLIGVLFLATSGSLYVSSISNNGMWVGLVTSLALAAISGWYILTGRYLTLEQKT